MVKQSKMVYIMGSIVIGIITIIAVVAGLMLGGVIDASSHKLVFVSKSEEVVYTGQALVCNDYELESGELKAGHTAQVIMTGSQTEVGESENSFVVAIFDENGADVTLDYEITTHYGTLKVLPKALFVKSGDATESYSGEPVKNAETAITAGELMDGHTIEYIVTGARTDAGKSDNTFLVIIRDKTGVDVTKNYKVDYAYGVLEVLPMEVAIDCEDRTVEYDGKDHSIPNDQWHYVNQNKRPADGLEVQVFFSGGINKVGSANVKLASVVVMDGDRDVSFNYEFTFAGANVEVTPRKITIVSGDGKKPYDGTPLTNDSKPTVVEENGLLDGHDITEYIITGSQTQVGDSPNTLDPDSIVISDGENDVTDNYEITVKNGTLLVTAPSGNDLLDTPGIDDTDPSKSDKDTLEKVVAKVTANHNGAMYLRKMSYQDYNGGSSWTTATEYNRLLEDTYSMNYLVGVGLKNRSIAVLKSAKILPIESSFGYCLPYFYSTVNTGGSEIQTSDTVNNGSISSAYFPYYYNVDNSALYSGYLGEFTDMEDEYYDFVEQHYLNKTSDASYIKAMITISSQGWDRFDADIISKVCEYVQGLADYSLDTDIEEKETDVILAMLNNTDKKYTALCRHYAGAGIALFRALGIPARYTVGFMIDAKDGEEVEVKVKDGHAWVEVYLKGIGWVPVECTAPSSGGGSNNGKPLLTMKPVETKKEYDDGKLLEPYDEVVMDKTWEEFKKKGYYLESVDVVGARGEVGKGETYIDLNSIKICDQDGNDATSEFEYDLETGVIHIYKYKLTIYTSGAEKIYDATPLKFIPNDDDIGYRLEGDIFSDYNYSVTLTGQRETVGVSANTAKIVITDANEQDITDIYLITYKYGSLVIKRRPIKIIAGSMCEEYTAGKVLEIAPNAYEIEGTLALSTHRVEAKVVGSLESFGVSYTKVESVRIYNTTSDSTVEVTDQYEISFANGELKMIIPD